MTSTHPETVQASIGADLVSTLTLEQKVELLTGRTAWRLRGIEAIGLREVVMSDGPAGVRGTSEIDGETSVSTPAPSAVSATWDRNLVERTGRFFALEARRHGVDVVLAPVVNLQRTPVGGRHFECYSEDPLLTGDIAVSFITGIQSRGVGACVKHYLGNESETGRTEYTASIDERTLREVYLAPFERAVLDAKVWSIMAAYNGINDGVESAPATEHHRLLTGILKQEWGFDGVVVSDWSATKNVVEPALAGLDLVMPGPAGPWSRGLLAAVRAGEVPEEAINDKVARLLLLAERVGAIGSVGSGHESPSTAGLDDDAGLPAELAARSTVVLRRRTGSHFPVDAHTLDRVALIGPNAVDAFVQGGGSAHVTPVHIVTPEEGLRAALSAARPNAIELTVHRGGYARIHAPELDVAAICTDELTGSAGIRVEFLDAAGAVVESRVDTTWAGWLRSVPTGAETVRITADLQLAAPGDHFIGVGTVGQHRIVIDGTEISRHSRRASGEVVLDSSVNSPASAGLTVTITEPRVVRVVAEVQTYVTDDFGTFVRAALRHTAPGLSVDEEIAEAVAAASAADLAIVVVGTNDEVESEGWDRTTLALPGRQDDLVRAVLEVRPDAIIVVNAGAPVVLPWLDDAQTVLWTWFPGQDCGQALADVIFGTIEPSGRLPWTLPASEDDVPIPDAIPDAQLGLDYAEGREVGYRAWLRSERRPAAPFGHGLGWTEWEYLTASLDGQTVTSTDVGDVTVSVELRNVGDRAGREVVQVYLESTSADRPLRWLAGFATVDAAAGETVAARVSVPQRAREIWDVAAGGWTLPETAYRIVIGRSVTDRRLIVDLPASHRE